MGRHKYKLNRQMICEQLDARQLMAADIVPEVEPNNTESQPTRFALVAGQQVRLQGTSLSKDDKDFFAFTSPAKMEVAINAAGAAGAKLEVTTRSGSQLFETEPKDGLVTGRWQAQAGETYLLRMRASDKTSVSYDVLLEGRASSSSSDSSNSNNNDNSNNSASTSTGPEVEPNDRPSTATHTNLTTAAGLTLSGAASKRDRDFFRVEAASAGTVTIDTGTSGIKVSIETPSGAKLFESEPNDGVTTGSFSVSAGDVFLVRARGVSNSVTQYSLSLTLGDSTGSSSSTTTGLSNSTSPDPWLDSSDDGVITALDALLVINHLNVRGLGHGADDAILSLDTNDDRIISALDALLVVNRINDHTRGNDVNDTFDDSDIRRRRP